LFFAETRQRSSRSNPIPRQYAAQAFTQTQRAIWESIFTRVLLEQRGGSAQQQQHQQYATAQTSSNEMSSEETEPANVDPNVLQPILESIATETEAFGLVRFLKFFRGIVCLFKHHKHLHFFFFQMLLKKMLVVFDFQLLQTILFVTNR
jgi:hypothetical protein